MKSIFKKLLIKKYKNELIYATSEQLNLKNTLINGQAFNWEPIDDNEKHFIGVFENNYIELQENKEDGFIYYKTLPEDNSLEFEQKLVDYFQFEVDYNSLIKNWAEKDEYFKEVSEKIKGIRVLRQPPFQSMVSFIISQNNNIGRITKILYRLSEKYGNFIVKTNDKNFYSFPTLESLSKAEENEFVELGLGYRCKK